MDKYKKFEKDVNEEFMFILGIGVIAVVAAVLMFLAIY